MDAIPHFCDNEGCQLHIPLAPGTESWHGRHDLTFTAANGNSVRSTRWPVLRADDEKQFFFCTTCANVAAMLHSLK